MIVRADLHVHSAASWDGRSDLAALAQAAHARGLDAIAVCDHDLCTDIAGEFPVLLIPGVEITSTAGHILGLFLEKPLDRALWETGAPTPDAAIRAIRACGGLAVPAHPFSPQKLDEAALAALCPDAVEVQNARVALKNAARNAQAQTFAAQQTPTAAPTASKSANLWPMTSTILESTISFRSALAITRDFTLVRVSIALPRPP